MTAPAVPDGEMLAPARAIVRFIESREPAHLAGVFTHDAVILESVAPYVFEGPGAVARWAEAMRRHVDDHSGLHATLGKPQEFSRQGHTAFYSLPVSWEFASGERRVRELGAMALLVVHEDSWRVSRYAWAVASMD